MTGSSGAVTPERTVNLVWTPSVDDKVVGTIVYNGHHIPIDGVRGYEILRGTDESSLETIDDRRQGFGGLCRRERARGRKLADLPDRRPRSGQPDGGSALRGADGPQAVLRGGSGDRRDDERMLRDGVHEYAQHGRLLRLRRVRECLPEVAGSARIHRPGPDTNDDGSIDLIDFVNFASCFGAELPGATKRAVATRTPGVNDNVELSMSLDSERVVAGETISVGISLANVEALTAYGLSLSYDPSRFEFVEAVAADEELLKSTGGDTPLFKTFQSRAGELKIANAVVPRELGQRRGADPERDVQGPGRVRGHGEVRDRRRHRVRCGVAFEPGRDTGCAGGRDDPGRVRLAPELSEPVQPGRPRSSTTWREPAT